MIFLIFISAVLLDVIWAVYIKKISQGKPVIAASVSVLIYLLGAFVVINYVKNNWYLLVAAAGAFVGTYFATKYIK